MPTEPENSIVKLLKTYAAKRWDDAGPPRRMSDATRRVLQEEVARSFPITASREREPRFGFLAAFWPRLALGGAAFALMAAGALVWLQVEKGASSRINLAQKTERALPIARLQEDALKEELLRPGEPAASAPRLAKDLSAAAAESRGPIPVSRAMLAEQLGRNRDYSDKSISPLAYPMPATPVQLEDTATAQPKAPQTASVDSKEKSQSALGADAASPEARSIRAPALSAGVERAAAIPTAAQRGLSSSTPDGPAAAAAPALPEPPGAMTLSLARAQRSLAREEAKAANFAYFFAPTNQSLDSLGGGSNAIRWLFSQVDARAKYRRNYNSPSNPDVLNRFEAQFTGNNLRLIDADGSVYEGTIQYSSQRVSAGTTQIDGASNAAGAETAELRRFTNSSQKQPPALNPTLGVADAANLYFQAAGTNRRSKERVVIIGSFLNTNRIEGKATVGGTHEFRLEALRVGP